jgi:hypothetical protein
MFLYTKNFTVIVVALVLNCLLQNAGDLNRLPLLCDLAGPNMFAIAFGVTNMVNCLAGGLGVFVTGLLKSSRGLAGVFAGIVGILILEALVLFVGYFLFLKRDLEKVSLRAKLAAAPSRSV